MANMFGKGQTRVSSTSKPLARESTSPVSGIPELEHVPHRPNQPQAIWTIEAGVTGEKSVVLLDGVPCTTISKAVLTLEVGQLTTLKLSHPLYGYPPWTIRDHNGNPVHPEAQPGDVFTMTGFAGRTYLEWGGHTFLLKEVSDTDGE